ncbi:MAG: helix-turn-helix domain-containing protein [Planctomycetes bacterium]|nr:helix-turn-helix domain-containing protein [Planctomycetota bacterium]
MPTAEDEFGLFFRNRRTALGLNLSEFCRQNGFDKGNMSRLERGLKKPPESPDLLQAYADALQLQPDSEDWKALMRHAAIARGKLPSAVSDERAADVEEMFRRLGRRLHDSWVKARDLEQWSPTRDAQAGLPTLIRKLIYASTEPATSIEMPGGEGVQRHGWDGVVEAPTKSPFVPAGISGWEISVQQNPTAKANRDYKNRKKGPLGLPPSEVTFVFVTSCKWDKKQEWRDEKRKLGKWKSVEVYDSSDLEAWLEVAPGVDAWIAERLGLCPGGVISISDHWERLSRLTSPRLKPDVFLVSREKTAKELRAFLLGTPGVMPIECRSPIEALDFAAAYLVTVKSGDTEFAMNEDDRVRAQNRTVVVRDRAQWDGLSRATGPLNLLPTPSLSLTAEELNAAVGHGHRILIAATQFSNHRLQPVMLPRPSRYDLEKALCKSGFERKDADKAARAAGGNLSVLKRSLSTIPSPQLPEWCSDPELADFMPILLIGAWDDASEADRTVLSRLSGRPYGELQNVANRFTLVKDGPLTRIESRWRLVSPEDSWWLVGAHVTDDLLSSFETIAIEVLSQQNESLSLSADERIKASFKGTLKPSDLLRRGISETTAILGSGFGPVAKRPGTRDRANRIVRTTLQRASWLRWATLGNLLPLLAEAAPDTFLAAISADLRKKNRSELTKVLADDGEDHPLFSRCNHAGLLRALEALAWSPKLLPKACTILARLEEVDSGQKSGNRPAGSLGEILLSWYPQTAAGVDKRIAALKSLADRTPTVAWKVLFAMLPRIHSTSTPTHRPIWRDWVSDWQEGASGADYWRQVNAAAGLIVELVGNDPTRWSKVLDELQVVPEPHRNQLIDRLRNFPVDEIDPEERRRLAEHLRKTIQRHRDYAGAQWSLPADSVDALEQALPTLLPDGICERHAWLFEPWVELEGFRGDHDGMEAEVGRLRADALSEIIDHQGFDGVLKLADIAESPGQVGATLAQTESAPDDRVLPGLLRSSDANHQSLATNYAGVRIVLAGWDWIRTLSLDQWSPRDAAVLLSQASPNPQPPAWNFAESLSEDVFREYWKTVPAHSGYRLDREQLEFACQELMKADRPETAIALLKSVTFGEVTVSPSIVMDALTAYLEWRQSNTETRLRDDTLSTIQGLFGWLQETIQFNNDEPTRQLGQLEWEYLDLLDGFGALPKTLIYCLSDDPGFFAQLIALIFRSNNEQESDTESTEEQRKKASHGYRLLMNWKRVPGTQSDGSVEEKQLLEWLESARSLCRESGHLEIADSKIGEMLASWPQPEDRDTMWPCEEICDAIEETDSDELDHGFQIGVMNSRGVICRSPLAGGDLERKEAAKYRRWAELCDMDWPRTAASLRCVAESYEFDAQREDARASEQAQERH